jgi:hypothetical protein
MDKVTANAPTMDLKRFACAHCGLSGPLPAWDSNSTCLSPGGLQFFDVSYNSLSDAAGGMFNSFGALQVFNVSYNSLLAGNLLSSDICPAGFTQMLELRLSHNGFSFLPASECGAHHALPRPPCAAWVAQCLAVFMMIITPGLHLAAGWLCAPVHDKPQPQAYVYKSLYTCVLFMSCHDRLGLHDIPEGPGCKLQCP